MGSAALAAAVHYPGKATQTSQRSAKFVSFLKSTQLWMEMKDLYKNKQIRQHVYGIWIIINN